MLMSSGAVSCRVVEKVFPYKVVFEQRSEGIECASHINFWGKSILGEGLVSRKGMIDC